MIFAARKVLGWDTEEFFNATPIFYSRMLDVAAESTPGRRKRLKKKRVRTAEDFRRMP